MKKLIITALIGIVLSACNKNNQAGDGYVNSEVQMPEEDKVVTSDIILTPQPNVAQMKFVPPVVVDDYGNQASKTGINNVAEKKIVKEGELHFKTADIAATRKALYASLKKLGGYVSEESETNESGQKEVTLNTRIPAENFDLFLGNVADNAESIDSKSIRIKDVTTQFIDITTQLSNKKKLEERYLDLLKKGSKITDLLEIESKLTEIRSDIESTQVQLNYLSKQIAYSSLDVTFYAQQSMQDNGQTFGYKIKNAFARGWHALGTLFFGFIAWWPVWLIILVIIFFVNRWRKN